MNGYVIDIQSIEELQAMIAGESYSTIRMRRAEAQSNYAFKPLEPVELYRSRKDKVEHVMVPQPSHIENIRELLQFAADQRGDGDMSHVTPPTVRILPTRILWPIIGAGATGAFFQDIGEVWILCPDVCAEGNQTAWFDATLVHELTHFLQLRARGWDIKADLQIDLCDREFEAVRAQRNWLLKVGNVSWLTREMDEHDLHELVEDDYGPQAQRVACALADPDFVAPEYKGPRS